MRSIRRAWTRHRTADTQAPEPADAGVSIVEVLVAAGLLVGLSAIVSTVAILGLRTTTGMEARLDNATQGQLGMAATSKVLRTAVLPAQLEESACVSCASTAVVRATPTRVVFYANLNNTGDGPSLVTLEVVADPAVPGTGQLRETSQPPQALDEGRYTFCDAALPTCAVQTRIVSTGLRWPSPDVFAYYDFAGDLIDATTVPAGDLPRISSVDVSLTAQRPSGGVSVASTTLVQRVRLPNAEINLRADETEGP